MNIVRKVEVRRRCILDLFTGAIIGIVVGVIGGSVLIVVTAVIVAVVCRKRARARYVYRQCFAQRIPAEEHALILFNWFAKHGLG